MVFVLAHQFKAYLCICIASVKGEAKEPSLLFITSLICLVSTPPPLSHYKPFYEYANPYAYCCWLNWLRVLVMESRARRASPTLSDGLHIKYAIASPPSLPPCTVSIILWGVRGIFYGNEDVLLKTWFQLMHQPTFLHFCFEINTCCILFHRVFWSNDHRQNTFFIKNYNLIYLN